MIKLLVRTDEPLAAIGLKVLFQSSPDISLDAVVSATPELLGEISTRKPDVILLGANGGIDTGLLTVLRRQAPAAKVILWVPEITAEQAYQAIDCGVRGILRKNVPPDDILACVRKVHEGDLCVEKTFTDVFLKGQAIQISRRESELITLVTQGLKNKEIAEAMWLTEGTVKVYLSNLFKKLRAKDRVELALFGMRNAQTAANASVPYRGSRVLLRAPAEPMHRPAPFWGATIVANTQANLTEEVL